MHPGDAHPRVSAAVCLRMAACGLGPGSSFLIAEVCRAVLSTKAPTVKQQRKHSETDAAQVMHKYMTKYSSNTVLLSAITFDGQIQYWFEPCCD